MPGIVVVPPEPENMDQFDRLPREVRDALNYSGVRLLSRFAVADLERYGQPHETVKLIREADQTIQRKLPNVASQ